MIEPNRQAIMSIQVELPLAISGGEHTNWLPCSKESVQMLEVLVEQHTQINHTIQRVSAVIDDHIMMVANSDNPALSWATNLKVELWYLSH